MRVLIIQLAHVLLIITAFNIKENREKKMSPTLLQKLTAQLEAEISEHFKEESGSADERTKFTVKPGVPYQGSGDITMRLYPNGIKYAFEQVMLAIRHDAMRHHPHSMRTSYHGMEINVNSLQIVDFLVPTLEVEQKANSKFRFSTHGGGMRYLGLYSAVYKTTREGQFEAFLEDIRIQLDVSFDEVNGKTVVAQEKCSAKLEDVLIQLTPTMPSQILELLQEQIQERFQENVCPALLSFLEKVASKTQALASIEEVAQRTERESAPCIVQHEKAAWRFDNKGLKLSFKRSNPREKRSIAPNNKEFQTLDGEMASVSMTEEYINEMLVDLVEKGNVLFHLHMIPEIEGALRTECSKDEHCLGSIISMGTAVNASGRLDSRVITAPFVEIRNHESAILHIALHSVLSFQNRAAHHRIPYLTLEVLMKLQISKLLVEQSSQDGYYRWSAQYEIMDIQLRNMHTDFENMKDIAGHIEELLNKHRVLIEGLLSAHLNGDLPFHLNPYLHLQPKPAIFGHNRVNIPLNFTVKKQLLPAFQFSSHHSFGNA